MKNIKVEGLFRNVTYPIELYDKNGNKIYYKNSKGYSCIREFDKNNNQIYFKNSKGYSWIREYDENNNEIYLKDSNEYSWISEYDDNGNQIYFKNSEGYSWVKEYDKNGNYIYFKDSKGIIRDNRPKKKYTVKELEELTGIEPEHQRLIGKNLPTDAHDELLISSLQTKGPVRLMVVGSTSEVLSQVCNHI